VFVLWAPPGAALYPRSASSKNASIASRCASASARPSSISRRAKPPSNKRPRGSSRFVGAAWGRALPALSVVEERVHRVALRLGVGAAELDQPPREAAVEQEVAREIGLRGLSDVE
jgi:hypothetical protein